MLATLPVSRRDSDSERRAEIDAPARMARLSALSLAGLGRPLDPRPDWERDATGAARSWLRLVDEGRHAASWYSAARLLRESVKPPEWERALRAVRAPLGGCRWRTLRRRSVVEGPSRDLKGPYVVIRFESVFEHCSRATETVTPVLGPDGRWRVAAYFIS